MKTEELVLLETEPLAPRNMIAVGFKDDPIAAPYFFFDMYPAPGASDENMIVRMHLDTETGGHVDPATFQNWVEGSKFKTVSERLNRLETDFKIAALSGARLITSLPSAKDLALLDLRREAQKYDILTTILTI